MLTNKKKWHEIKINKKDGRIYHYLSHSYRENKMVKNERKLIGVTGVDGKFRKSKTHPSNYKTIREYGQILLLGNLVEQCGLHKCLRIAFPDITNELLCCVYFCIISNMNLSNIQSWMENYLLPFNVDLSSQRVSLLKKMINEERIMEFLKIWSKRKQENEYLAYDTTSISTYSNNIEEAEFGFNKDYDDMKQINLALLSSYSTGVPYFYRIINGSIRDVSTLTNLIKYTDHINLKNVKLVMDRGFYKYSNISLLNTNKINFIMGLPFSNLTAKSLVDSVLNEIGNPDNYFRINKKEMCYVITRSIKIEEETLIAHIYLDKVKKIQLEENFMADIDTYRTLNKDKLWSDLSPDGMRKYFVQTSNHRLGEINQFLIKEHLRYRGYFILITNHEKDAVKSLQIYRNKDCVEKDFQNLKSTLSFDRIRTHNSDTTIGRIFIAFLTLILKCYINYIMKTSGLCKDFSFNSMMFELQKLKIITFKKNNPIFSEINKKVKSIFEAFKIQLPKNLY